MQKLNDFFDWGISSGFFIAAIWFLWGYVKPLLDAKVKHAKTAQQKELLSLIEGLADTAVTSLVSDKVSGSEKFQQATKIVDSSLAAKGLSAPQQTVEAAVQSAYEKSNLTPSVDPYAHPQTGVVIDND